MLKEKLVANYRKATARDIGFLSQILANAAVSSGVNVKATDIPYSPDIYQYVEGFPKGIDTGIVAETNEGVLIGAAWIRLLPTDIHAINEHLPELTMGVLPQYQRKGIGKRLMEELYKAARAIGITKISLGVHKENLPAVSLYKQQNWIVDGYFEEYVMMSKAI